jgi:two-component system CheB/CheR fusion protein
LDLKMPKMDGFEVLRWLKGHPEHAEVPIVVLSGRFDMAGQVTPQATKIIKLIPGDAGRPITDLVSDLQYPELADDARVVLQKLAAVEKTISAHDGRWFTVRIMPYRTMDDRINGVVITFANITVAKNLEGKLRGKHTALEKRVAEDSAERAASEAGGGKRTKAAGKAPRTRKH